MITGSSSTFAVMRELRCAGLRARLAVNEIDAMTVALGVGFIGSDNALEHLAEIGALRLVAPSSAPPVAS